MKNVFYIALLLGVFGFTGKSVAQVSVQINVGSQPSWGPTGYDFAQYYYMPELDVYYDVSSRNYIYLQGNRWIMRTSLPGRYRNYDLYRTYKVVINQRSPWHNHRKFRHQYGHYAHNRSQSVRRQHHTGHRHDNHRVSRDNHRPSRDNHRVSRDNHRVSRDNHRSSRQVQRSGRHVERQQKAAKQQHKRNDNRGHQGRNGSNGNNDNRR